MSCTTIVCGTGGWTGPKPGDPDNNATLSAAPVFGGIAVSWTYPGTNPQAVAHTLLLRSGDSVFDHAVQIALVGGSSYVDAHEDAGTPYYYWIRFLSVNGTLGDPIGPATASADGLAAAVLAQISGEINASMLAQSLRTQIDDIVVTQDAVATEIADRLADHSALADAIAAVQTSADSALTYINQEITQRTEGDSALLTQINTVAAGNADNAAAIVTEQDARVAADSAEATARLALEAAYQAADTATLSSAQSYVQSYAYAKSAADAALAAQASSLTTSFQAGDAATLTSAHADVVSYAYSKSAADSAVATKVDTLKAVLNGGALNADPDTTNVAEFWLAFSGANLPSRIASDGLGPYAFRSTDQCWLNERRRITIDPTKTYKVSGRARQSSDSNGSFYLIVACFDANGDNIPGSGQTQWYYPARGVSPGTSWTAYSGSFGAGTANPFPAGAKTFTIGTILQFRSDATARIGTMDVEQLRLDDSTNAVALQAESTVRASQTGDLYAQYTVKVDVNGYVAGFGLASTASNGIPSSSFIVNADKFAVTKPTTAFAITTNGIVRAGNVVTVTTSAAHGLKVGEAALVAGVTDASFNGQFTVATVPSATSITYAQTGANATSTSGTLTRAPLVPFVVWTDANGFSKIGMNGNLLVDGSVTAYRVLGGAYSSYAWPAAGAGNTGFYLGPEGLKVGNANNGKYFQVDADGNLTAPQFSIVNGNASFSGVLTAAAVNAVNTINIANEAVMIPRFVSSGTYYWGNNAWQSVLSYALTLTQPGRIAVVWNGFMSFPSGQRNWEFIIRIWHDGSYEDVCHPTGQLQLDTPTMVGGTGLLAAQTVTVEILFFGIDSNAQMKSNQMMIFGAMK